MTAIEDEWLWGWDPTPGIVSVWAEPDGRAFVWRRLRATGELVRDDVQFRPWLVIAALDDLAHLGDRLRPERDGPAPHRVTYRELAGPGALRFLVRAGDLRTLVNAVTYGASRRLGHPVGHVRDLGASEVLVLPPEEQYLVASGRTYFRGLAFDDLRRLQLDLETTGLDPAVDRIFVIAVRDPDGRTTILEAAGDTPHDEAALITRLVALVAAADPDVIENHNLHGFDLPFLERRARLHGLSLALGRPGVPGFANVGGGARAGGDGARVSAGGDRARVDAGGDRARVSAGGDRARVSAGGDRARVSAGGDGARVSAGGSGARAGGTYSSSGISTGLGLRTRAARRGVPAPGNPTRKIRYTMPGRELIDTLDAVVRHDFSARDLPGHGLKAVARHMGLARADREHIPGADIHRVWQRDPDRVRRYAGDDVHEVAGLARTLGGAAFALAGMAPRRYERLADAGAATGVIDPLLVRAYLRSGAALPAHEPGDGTPHNGAALHLFAAGVAHRIVKADVASLYPSLMREYRIGPARDRLGALLAIVDRLVDHRLAAKARGRAATPGSSERFSAEAMSAAMKLVVNSAYGYLGASGLTRFSDVHAANRVTHHGRQVLGLLCRELAARGVTLLEADTDGVYFAVPAAWTETDERRVVAEVAALLPPRVQLEFEGRYAAMLSHEPKNYALKPYAAPLILRGVAFRSSRAEPFGEQFLRRALEPLLAGDLAGVQQVYIATVTALRKRAIATRDVTTRVRLTQPPEQYLAARGARHQLPYEAVLATGRTTWAAGERVRVYRATRGRARLFIEPADELADEPDAPDDDASDEPATASPAAGARSSPDRGLDPGGARAPGSASERDSRGAPSSAGARGSASTPRSAITLDAGTLDAGRDPGSARAHGSPSSHDARTAHDSIAHGPATGHDARPAHDSIAHGPSAEPTDPRTNIPSADISSANGPRTNIPSANIPSANGPRTDTSRTDAPRADAPRADPADPRDYDIEHYLRVLRDHYAVRFARAMTAEDYAAVFADPEQPSLFARSLAGARPILTAIASPEPTDDDARPRGLHS